MGKVYDICIIGAGASGLAAAVAASSSGGRSVIILEKTDRPGHKIAVSGAGRCNLSNIRCEDKDSVLRFFSSIGLMTMTDREGRIYPHSEDARDVAECLTCAAVRQGVRIETFCEVTGASASTGGFLIVIKNKPPVAARRLLIAAGGKSAPKTGSTGDSYKLARSFGHTVNRLVPVLTGVETTENMIKLGLPGVRQKCLVTLTEKGAEKFKERGEVQFTDYGLSGICVFNMTRYMDISDFGTGLSEYRVILDFLPDTAEENVRNIYQNNLTLFQDSAAALCSIVKRPLAAVIAGRSDPAAELKHMIFRPVGLKGWGFAQVTRGGVSLSETDAEGGSRIVPGLYFAGEALDFDGPCGGYNLNHAWRTGMAAGRAMADDEHFKRGQSL